MVWEDTGGLSARNSLKSLARPKRFELLTPRFESGALFEGQPAGLNQHPWIAPAHQMAEPANRSLRLVKKTTFSTQFRAPGDVPNPKRRCPIRRRFKRVVGLHFADTGASIGIATGTYLPNTPAIYLTTAPTNVQPHLPDARHR